MNLDRRHFLHGACALPLMASSANRDSSGVDQARRPLRVGLPFLQAPGETTMGVSWAVSCLCKGEVEYADNPGFASAKRARPGSLGLIPIDDHVIQVRLENLKPDMRYYYRTVTTPFVSYANIYEAELGAPIVSDVYSFTTLGAFA